MRLLRVITAQGYTGDYTIQTDYLRIRRPAQEAGYEVYFWERWGQVQTGVFGANMQVSLTNDGPVTFWLRV